MLHNSVLIHVVQLNGCIQLAYLLVESMTEVQNFPKNRKFPPPPRKFFQEISPSCFIFTAHRSTLFDTKYKSKSMATFCSVRYCSYNIGILSNCSFLKRFKTTEPGETNLNRRCCSAFLKKIQCLFFS
jgi:hypothetical protein